MVFTGKKITIPLFLLIFTITALSFIAPLLIDPGTVRGMDGNANMLDYSNQWDSLPVIPRIVYYFGDFNCHQIENRSFLINDNKMPMCSRCIGIFAGMSLGIGIAILAPVRVTATEIILKVLPGIISRRVERIDRRINKRMRTDLRISVLLVSLSFLLAIPMIIDGMGQSIFRLWESTNLARAITGFLFGFISFLWFSAYIHAVLYIPEDDFVINTPPKEGGK